MKIANRTTIQLKGRSVRFRTKCRSVIGIDTYARPISESLSTCVQSSDGFQVKQ